MLNCPPLTPLTPCEAHPADWEQIQSVETVEKDFMRTSLRSRHRAVAPCLFHHHRQTYCSSRPRLPGRGRRFIHQREWEETMKKLTLDLNALEVQSFATDEVRAAFGTVHGRQQQGSEVDACPSARGCSELAECRPTQGDNCPSAALGCETSRGCSRGRSATNPPWTHASPSAAAPRSTAPSRPEPAMSGQVPLRTAKSPVPAAPGRGFRLQVARNSPPSSPRAVAVFRAARRRGTVSARTCLATLRWSSTQV